MQFLESFDWLQTNDGTPTLRHAPSGQCMHHSASAARETLYVYGPVYQTVFQYGWSPRFLSVGLGLGYVELALAAYCVAQGLEAAPIHLCSIEPHQGLRDLMEGLLSGTPHASHQQVVDRFSQLVSLEPQRIIQQLRVWKQEGHWQIVPTLQELTSPLRFSGIFYDPFDQNVCQELWNSDFLARFFQRLCESKCVVASYSACSVFKKTLLSEGFTVSFRPGFCGKRECTLAVRDVSKSAREAQQFHL